MRKRGCILFLCLALLLFCAPLPAQAAVFSPDIRVLLSLGKQAAFTFTPVGEFTLKEDPSLTVGTDALTVSVVGGRVSIQLGGKTVTAASLTFLSGNYGGRTDYIRLKNAEHGTCTYLGNLTFDAQGGAVRGINTLPIEQYLYGVVPHEMSNRFPLDALKAQAVCARGFAVARCSSYGSRAYDILDTSKDQVYRGYASRNTRAIAAVDDTRGQVLTYEGDIVETYYSASNGGQTERTGNVWENDFPYYINADDPYDIKNDSSIEETSFIPEAYTAETTALMDVGVLAALSRAANAAAGQPVTLQRTVQVTPKSPSYEAPSRCYTEVDITLVVGYQVDGAEKAGQITVTLPLEGLRFGSFENTLGRIGASKTRLRMRGAERGVCHASGKAYAGWYLTERRYGHGVGLSQRGAQERARSGQPYADILTFYYVNTALSTVGAYESAPTIESEAYSVREWGVSKVSPGTSAEALLQRLSSKGTLSIVSAKGRPAAGTVGTGHYVRVTYTDNAAESNTAEGNTAFFDLPIIIYGDLDGDGAVTEGDVSALQGHLARSQLLTGARLLAADLNHDGTVTATDLLQLIHAVNGDARISQGG